MEWKEKYSLLKDALSQAINEAKRIYDPLKMDK